MIRLGILGSTRGTAMDAIVAAIQTGKLAANVAIVISNKADAAILERAEKSGLSTQFIDPKGLSREQFDQQVSTQLKNNGVDLIVLIGYMRILSAEFVSAWENRIINIHPSLLPAFAGKMDLDVHKAVLAAGVKETGCTVHYVTQEVDAGPIILQKKCLVHVDDSAETLKQRVQALEGEALVAAISQILITQH